MTSLKSFVDEWMQRILQESRKAISLYVPQIKEPNTYITPAAFARIPLARVDFSSDSPCYAAD
jgi:hypothetical protein